MILMENEEKKESKFSKFIWTVLTIILMAAIVVLLNAHNEVVYGFVFLIALIGLFVWKELPLFLKIMDIVLLVYSPIIIFAYDEVIAYLDKLEVTNAFTWILWLLLFVAEILAIGSSKIVVLFIIVIFGMMLMNLSERFSEIKRRNIIFKGNKKYGTLPKVQRIDKDNKSVYLKLQHDKSNGIRYDKNLDKIVLIYETGTRKKEVAEFLFDRDMQYSLKWDGGYEVVLEKYNLIEHKLVGEEKFSILNEK